MNLTLAAAVVMLALWFLTTFLVPVGLGIVHLLLAAGVVLLIRWWALAGDEPPGRPAGR